MDYGDIKRFGLHNVLPHKKRYGTDKDRRIVSAAIRSNYEFVQFALEKMKVQSLNSIIDQLVKFVIKCNDVYYNYELVYYDEKGNFYPQGVANIKKNE